MRIGLHCLLPQRVIAICRSEPHSCRSEPQLAASSRSLPHGAAVTPHQAAVMPQRAATSRSLPQRAAVRRALLGHRTGVPITESDAVPSVVPAARQTLCTEGTENDIGLVPAPMTILESGVPQNEIPVVQCSAYGIVSQHSSGKSCQ